jgi:hypothetical protein
MRRMIYRLEGTVRQAILDNIFGDLVNSWCQLHSQVDTHSSAAANVANTHVWILASINSKAG